MTQAAEADEKRAALPRLTELQWRQWGLVAIVVAQAGWLAILMHRGWYLQADLGNLATGRVSALDWPYLSTSLGGHFGPLGRTEWWLLAHTAPLNYTFTIVLRVAAQAAATVVLYRLIEDLTGPHRRTLVIVGLYAFSPLLVPGTLWLTSGIGLGQAQLLLLLALHRTVAFVRTGRRADAVYAGLLIGVMALLADQDVVVIALFPWLAFGFLYPGSVRQRLAAFRAQWLHWLLAAAPTMVLGGFYLLGNFGSQAEPLHLSQAWDLVRLEWLRSLGPAVIGGPWQWLADPNTFLGFSAPPLVMVIAGQVVLLGLIAIGWRRSGTAALYAWAMPIFTALVGVLVVGIGRFGSYGTLIPITPRYSFGVAVPLALAVALSLTPRAEAAGAPVASRRAPAPVVTRPLLRIGLVALLASCLISSTTFVDIFARNPTKAYVGALRSHLDEIGPTANLYDTAVPDQIITSIEPHHHISDLLALTEQRALFDDASRAALVIDSAGTPRAAQFETWATGVGRKQPNCGIYLHGAGSWTLPLSAHLSAAEWWVRLSLFQSGPSHVVLSATDKSGRAITPEVGGVVTVASKLGQVNARLPVSSPASITITTADATTSICLAEVAFGRPVPIGSR